MPVYDIEKQCEEVAEGDVFQQILSTLGITLASDVTDPLDHSEFVIPRTTPMAPVYVGTDHDHGLWMPIRRTRAADAEAVGDPVIIVDDAEPFKVGDTVQIVDVAGPGTAIVDGGAITLIDYATNTITMTNGAAVWNIDDWVEVTENGAADDTGAVWRANRLVGMLKDAYDARPSMSAIVGAVGFGEVVTQGSIRAEDINFNTTPVLDQIMIPEFTTLNVAQGGIQIITLEHGDTIVDLPDLFVGS